MLLTTKIGPYNEFVFDGIQGYIFKGGFRHEEAVY